MFTICIDDNGYYCEGDNGILVEVDTIPEVTDVRFLKAYRYNDGILLKDEKKYKEIRKEIDFEQAASPDPISLEQERLEATEQKNKELEDRIAYLEKLITENGLSDVS